MLDPNSLDIINEPVLYQIEPKTSDIYTIDNSGAKYSSSIYENDGILRSLLNKQQAFNTEFINSLYDQTQAERIYYILNYDNAEKYVLSFKLPTKDKKVAHTTLKSLKENKVKIINWIRKNCGVKQEADFYDEVQVFPRYSVPNITCEVHQDNIQIKANLKDVQISGVQIECEIDSKLENHSEIKFGIGKTEYILPSIKIWESTDSEKKFKNAGYQLDFHDYADYKRWKTFIMAMHLRSQNSENSTGES